MQRTRRRAFTLIELVVVISILAILAGVIVPRVSGHMKAARDARRLADVKAVRAAIEQYYWDKGEYPRANGSSKYGGWDVSHDGNFIRQLRDEGYLDDDARDPIDDDTFHYRYLVYAQGSYGCKGGTDFYVLGIRNFESPDFADEHEGFFQCKDRDWSSEFAYVTGGGASYRD